MRIAALLFPLLVLLLPTISTAGIEGGAERSGFTAGDIPLFATNLAQCPVGEPAPHVRIGRGGQECARFMDRIWIHPLQAQSMLYIEFPEAIEGDFSLEFPVWLAEEGCAFVDFHLHDHAYMARLAEQNGSYMNGAYAGGRLACAAQPSGFGSRDTPGRLAFDLQTRLQKERMHRIAVQVRRDQIRFFVDGHRVGMRPFHPQGKIGGVSFYLARFYGSRTAFADAPALIGDIRLATYSGKERIPEAERDLAKDLGAIETPKGLKITLSESILFAFGDWHLKPEAKDTLDKLARLIRLRNASVRIEGHTDNIGGARCNLILSELRAHAVALALAQRGVNASRLAPTGFGESRPVANNASETGRAKNRRVEIFLLPHKQ